MHTRTASRAGPLYFYLFLVAVAVPGEVEDPAPRQAHEKVVLARNFRTKLDVSFFLCQRAVMTTTTSTTTTTRVFEPFQPHII